MRLLLCLGSEVDDWRFGERIGAVKGIAILQDKQPILGRSGLSKCGTRWICGVCTGILLMIHAGMLVGVAFHQSPNEDEPGHLAAGVYTWYFGIFDVYRVNPPLARTLASLPVVMCRPKVNCLPFRNEPGLRVEWQLGAGFIGDNGGKDALDYFVLGRCTLIIVCLVGAYTCWRWAGQLFGQASGITALGLWCFSPSMIAWGSTICPDAVSAAVGVIAVYVLWLWFQRSTVARTIITGLVLGLAELCKFTLLVLYPLLPVLWIVYRLPERKLMDARRWLREGMMLVGAMLLSIYVINCGYLFDGSFTPLEEFRFQTMLFTGYDSLKDIPPEGANRFAGTWMGRLLVPLPASMIQGIDTQRYDFERGLPSYLRGQWANHGWWYYYVYALAIKEPLGTWCLLALAIGASIFGRRYLASWRDEMVVLAPLFVILAFVSSQTGFSLHSRYVIPTLPFLFVWTSKVARVFDMRPFTRKRLLMAATVVLAITWSVASSLAVYPHSMSYFNELAAILATPADASYPKPVCESGKNEGIASRFKYAMTAGPRNGPRHLLNSNIDWGQDLLYLKNWLDKHPDVKFDGLAYDCSYPASLLGMPETPFPAPGLECKHRDSNQPPDQLGPLPGWYALSVNYIYSRDCQHRYFLNFHPVATAGYSIYIYHITIDEANRVRKKLGLPELKEGHENEKVQVYSRGNHVPPYSEGIVPSNHLSQRGLSPDSIYTVIMPQVLPLSARKVRCPSDEIYFSACVRPFASSAIQDDLPKTFSGSG